MYLTFLVSFAKKELHAHVQEIFMINIRAKHITFSKAIEAYAIKILK